MRFIKVYGEIMAAWDKWSMWRLAWSMYWRFWAIHIGVLVCIGFGAVIIGAIIG